MKKIALIALILVGCIASTFAQDDIILHITDYPGNMNLCLDHNQRVIIYAEDGYENCPDFAWYVNGSYNGNNPLIINPLNGIANIRYNGCSLPFYTFYIQYFDAPIPNCFTHTVWKRQSQSYTLEAIGADSVYYPNQYGFIWNTGETTRTIDVTEPGTYTCESVGRICGDFTRTFIVRDNVELYRATVDLTSNLNQTTWQTTPEQAEYISAVKVYRDGLFIGSAPYENGYFLDAIGSDNAARNYRIVGVTAEGAECPIPSYQKGTIHTTYYLDVNDNLNMTWNIPYVEEGAQGTLACFQVCKYDPVTGQLTVVDQVNSLITDYTCGVNQFEGGYPVIAAVFSNGKGREFEDLSFSNMYTDIAIQPHEITINLEPGWTWVSYPYAVTMSIATALGDFVPMEGDIIKSQLGASSYRNGQWRGSFQQLIPGFGYKYFSTRTEPTTLVFDLSSSRASVRP